MAYCIKGEKYYDDGNIVDELPHFWNITSPIYPNGNGIRTDVMLVQIMLKMFFLSNLASSSEMTGAIAIFKSSKTRFDDGIYGKNTRTLLKIYEMHIKSPHQDGIVRPVPMNIVYEGPYTKLKYLNQHWDIGLSSGSMGTTKEEQARYLFQPLLFREMYG